MRLIDMKICSKCKIEKELTDFYQCKKVKDGYKSCCKLCIKIENLNNKEKISEKNKIYYLNNKNKIINKVNDYYKNNKESILNKNKKYYIKNKEKIDYKNKIYYEKNKEKTLNYLKLWKIENKNLHNLYSKNAKAKRRSLEKNNGKLSKGIVQKLYQLQQGLCICCNEPLGDNYHLDHIMPLALGGTNTDNNVQLLKYKCNLNKHKKHPIDYMQSKGFLL